MRPWSDYFASNFTVTLTSKPGINAKFNVYFSPPAKMSSPVFAFHHGAGSSGLSFAVLAKSLREAFARDADGHVPGIISYDVRYHGSTKVESEDSGKPEYDYSLETLAGDFVGVVKTVYERQNWTVGSGQESVGECETPPLVFVGHSLGGSVVTSASNLPLPAPLIGTVVLDVVEGSAMEALQSMDMILKSRPKAFATLESGIEWHVRSLTIRNRESACVSVPGLLAQSPQPPPGPDTTGPDDAPWTWVTDLRASEPFWPSWFKGLSARFLAVRAARLLILAGTDRLDKDLMIGQMQGKYQLIVFQDSGHFIQEDTPDRTAQALLDFWMRNDRPQTIVPSFGSFRKS